MDLERLQIDRSARRRPRRSRASRLLGPALLLAGAGALAWVFRVPILRLADELRLPAVEVLEVRESSPLAATAISGTAANGYVVARNRAALSADTPGRIVEMNVEEGQRVRKGEVVARLYAEEYRAAFERAEAELTMGASAVARARAEVAAAGAELELARSETSQADARVADAAANEAWLARERARIEDLVADAVRSAVELDLASTQLERARAVLRAEESGRERAERVVERAAAAVEVAEAGLAELQANLPVLAAARDQARATLEKTEVRAPFDGIVVLKDAEVGEVVSPNSQGASSRGSVCTMVDFESLEVQVELPETSLSGIEIGAPATIFLDAWPARPYAGSVDRIWPTANRQKATVELRVVFEQLDEGLRPEMGVRVVFAPYQAPAENGERAPAILVPEECLLREDGRSGVFVVERGVARWRELALGERRGGRVVVERGLEVGERVVSRPPADLGDGDRVRLEE